MKKKLTSLFIIVAMLLTVFALPVFAENTDGTTDTTDDGTAPAVKGGLIAITFDDGPSANTEVLLDALKKRDAKVTFFIVGNRIDQKPELIKRAYKEGHEIANHSWDHSDLTKLGSAVIQSNLQKVEDKIYEVIGTDIGPLNVRPPYGAVNDSVRAAVDIPLILWDVDTSDWKSKDAERIKQNIINNAHDGAIILLHDLYEPSVKGAIAAIDELEKEGYTFVTVNELFRRKGQVLQSGTTYTNANNDGIDLGPLPEPDPNEEEKAKKEAKKAEREKKLADREDKGFPTGWLIFCGAILLIYGAGMLHMFRIVHIAPFDKIIQTDNTRKAPLNEKTAARNHGGSASGRDRRNTSQRRGNNPQRRK
ncbi:MAG: polysaccharide deacetylase family protein [Firmicutes bacterium]|nr:polysaccharide deacetylase family protein [Bacillota bacterium]